MKIIAALFAVASAITQTPDHSYKAKNDAVAAATAAIAFQQNFEADHLAMHTNNMNNAENECQTLKNHVRQARNVQWERGNIYPAFKTYN